MAGIDKIFGTYKQSVEFKKWLLKNEIAIPCVMGWDEDGDIVELMKPTEFVYEGVEFEGERAISNFPTAIDNWLWENCPIEFVRTRLKEQHGYGRE